MTFLGQCYHKFCGEISRHLRLTSQTDSNVVDFYLPVYGGIAGVNSLFSLARAFLFAYGGICAARNVHEKLIGVVMEAREGAD